jgi:hypothetical protein
LGQAFVEVALPGAGLVGARHTQAVPGSRIDGVLESTVVGPEGVRHTLLAVARGFSPAQLAALVGDLARSYGGPAEVVRRDGADAVLRYTVAADSLASPALQALARFQRAMGVPWTRTAGGKVFLLSAARDPAQAEVAAQRVGKYLADHGVGGEVAVRAPSREDAELRERLVGLLQAITWA